MDAWGKGASGTAPKQMPLVTAPALLRPAAALCAVHWLVCCAADSFGHTMSPPRVQLEDNCVAANEQGNCTECFFGEAREQRA